MGLPHLGYKISDYTRLLQITENSSFLLPSRGCPDLVGLVQSTQLEGRQIEPYNSGTKFQCSGYTEIVSSGLILTQLLYNMLV